LWQSLTCYFAETKDFSTIASRYFVLAWCKTSLLWHVFFNQFDSLFFKSRTKQLVTTAIVADSYSLHLFPQQWTRFGSDIPGVAIVTVKKKEAVVVTLWKQRLPLQFATGLTAA
jgi:hypothetical protein